MSQSLLPLLEAVVNGLQAIDTRFPENADQGRLKITIERSGQEAFDFGTNSTAGRSPLKPITGFIIEDNGIGFTEENMNSFETLDSQFKAAVGGRGVGRLLWLKAFDQVSVKSTYNTGGTLAAREFRFSVQRDVEHVEAPTPFASPGSIVRLDGFRRDYQQNARKSGEVIARDIFEHCIWYFLRPGGAPEVTVVDEDTFSLNNMLSDLVSAELPPSSIVVKGKRFEMINLRLKAANFVPRLYWCAARRVVSEDNLAGKIPGLHNRLKDADGSEFTYVSYLSSNFLDEHVRADRMGFDFAERQAGAPLDDEPTADDIRTAVFEQIEGVLAAPLQLARDEGKARVNDYVSRRAPRYRPVLSRMQSRGIAPDPSLKDADLELLLHRELRAIEDETLIEGQAVLADISPHPSDDYQQRLDRYLAAIKEINQSDLAAYVARRKVILEILAKLIQTNADGEYSLEEAIHSLVMPMRADSDGVATELPNLWIIDERLAFHEYLASDKPIKSMPITDSDSRKEPDILALKTGPVLVSEGQDPQLTSISVIEFKRPMRKGSKEDLDPIRQSLRYIRDVREGGVNTKLGRPIPESQTIPAFLYIIADLTPSLVESCRDLDLIPTQDNAGYFGYNKARKAYIEVMSFDRLLRGANERNRAFFDQLDLPTG